MDGLYFFVPLRVSPFGASKIPKGLTVSAVRSSSREPIRLMASGAEENSWIKPNILLNPSARLIESFRALYLYLQYIPGCV